VQAKADYQNTFPTVGCIAISIRYIILLLLVSGLYINGFTQTISEQAVSSKPIDSTDQIIQRIDSLEEEDDNMHKIVFGLDYMNKVVYWGRDFGINQFGVMPTLMYMNPKGFYAFYTGYYWSGEVHKYAKTDLGIGYEKFITDRWYVSAEYNRWFFTNGDKASRNSITNFFSLETSYDLDFITIESSFYYMRGNEEDYMLNLDIMKEFTYYKLFGADKITIYPTLYVTAGAHGANTPINRNQFTIATYESKNSGIINYEGILPVSYKITGLTEIALAYHYTYPVNQNPLYAIKPISYFTVESAWILTRWKARKKH